MSYSDIAQRVGISRVAVKMRVQALEKRGVIEEYTTIVHEKTTDTYCVFFGDRPCYKVDNPSNEFYEDMMKRQMASLSRAKNRY